MHWFLPCYITDNLKEPSISATCIIIAIQSIYDRKALFVKGSSKSEECKPINSFFLYFYISPNVHNISNVLMISSTCIMKSPDVLNTPNVLTISPCCTHGIPQCTEHPRCTEHTLYRVLTSMTETIQSTLDKEKTWFWCFYWPKIAFDTVNHSVLLKTKDHYGTRGIALYW